MVKKKRNKLSDHIGMVLVAATLLIIALGSLLIVTLQQKNEVSNKLSLYEHCTEVSGGFLKEDKKLSTCISYENVKSIKKSVKTFKDCEDDFFKRTGQRAATPAIGSEDPLDFINECYMPDGRILYKNSLEYQL